MADLIEVLGGWLIWMGVEFAGLMVLFVVLFSASFVYGCKQRCVMCSWELYGALQELKYPATKRDILAYAESKDGAESQIASLQLLSPRHTYRSIEDICCNAHQFRLELRGGARAS